MRRFTWDRERPDKERSLGPKIKSSAYIIRVNERGAREPSLKTRASISSAKRKAPVTLAGKTRKGGDDGA